MLYKHDLFTFLETVLSLRPDITFHVLTNAQHFTEGDAEILRRLPAGNVLWGVPLYAASPEEHDNIVGKPGAHEVLQNSLALLCRSGAAIELRTVVMQTNVAELPRLARQVATQLTFIVFWAIMQLENAGYARRDWDELFFDNSLDFERIGAAVDIARARGVDTRLYNFPLCTVPEAYQSLAAMTISDWKVRYISSCTDCEKISQCGGFFEWYPEVKGFRRIGIT